MSEVRLFQCGDRIKACESSMTIEKYREVYHRNAIDVGVADRCGYDIHAGWGPDRCPNELPCAEHSHLKCTKCGVVALYACPFAGQFVCGAPTCSEHRLDCGRH